MSSERSLKVAFLGTGLMGQPMAERLLGAGHEVMVYNRTAEKAAQLRSKGAIVAKQPDEAIRSAECVILMLADAQAIQQILLSESTRNTLSGRTVIQMGTIGPRESEGIQQGVVAAGAEYLEAPVLGSLPEARAGNLIVMVGATPHQFERWSSLLRSFGPTPLLIGPVGQAATVKLALNQLIASLTVAFALSLGLVLRRQVSVETFMAIVRESALYAPTFDKKLSRLVSRQFAAPNFPARHLLKDVDLFLGEAKSLGLETTGLEGVRRVLHDAVTGDWADADYSAVFNVVDPAR